MPTRQNNKINKASVGHKSQDGGYPWSIIYLCILQFKKMLSVRRQDYSLQCY